MKKMVEIDLIIPKNIKIQIPEAIFEEFMESADEENIGTIVAEALKEELKKVRFRIHYKKGEVAIQSGQSPEE